MPDEYNVLIVDDQEDTRRNVARLLQFENDINVVGTARTGQDAINQTVALDPDVVLMDINMPDMDGIEATELIQAQAPISQIVILSVQGDTNYMRRAMLAGARDFLTKPPKYEEPETDPIAYEFITYPVDAVRPTKPPTPLLPIISPEA